MKVVFAVLIVAFFVTCNSNKTIVEKSDLTENQKEIAVIQKAFPEVSQCILDKIAFFQNEAKANPPRAIYQYSYNGKTVYYISAPCCDIYSELVDNACNLLCAPDGGFIGKGDGKCINFNKTKSNEKLIWRDKRN
jgi:hypothetical protein